VLANAVPRHDPGAEGEELPRAPRGLLRHLGGFKAQSYAAQAELVFEGRVGTVSAGLSGSGRLALWMGWER
jgi:hypothetical protein